MHDTQIHLKPAVNRALPALPTRASNAPVVNGKVGQHFAINLNTGFAQPVDKPAIWQTVHARGGIDTLDPQSAKIAFARAPVAIGILPRFGDRLFGNTNGIFATAIITFGLGKNFFRRAWDVTPRFTRDIFAP